MGLMEKALNYKRRINGDGKKSIMDRITGPAETGTPGKGRQDAPAEHAASDAEIIYLDETDLVAVDGESSEKIETADEAGDEKRTDLPEEESAEEKKSDVKPMFSMESPRDDAYSAKMDRRAASQGYDDGALLDNMALYALSKDILRAESSEELFDIILFSIMGQVGVSSSSIMVPGRLDPDEWQIVESRGVTINREEVEFRANRGILKELLSRKEIIDIEEFKDNSDFSEDYYTYISIDTRLLVPVMHNENIIGVIILGNKLSAKDYTGEEKGFFTVIAEYSAFAYRAIQFKELNDSGSGPGSHYAAVDALRGKLASEGGIGRTRDIIREEFRNLGVVRYGIFIKDDSSRDYMVFSTEAEDRLKLYETNFRISSKSAMIHEITHAESPIMFNEARRSKPMVELFTDVQLKNMSVLDIFTFKLGGDMLGFIMVFEIGESAHLDTVYARLVKFTDFVFPYIAIIRDVEYGRGSYIDTIEGIFNRVNDEIKNARDLNIPVSLVLLSVKNYKRFHTLFGHEKVKSMFKYFEKFIRSRLSDRDFSVRYDRHKILIVLPGKDKKYAVPLANTICNELTHSFGTKEAQLLITFLTAEYPMDGKDAFSLVDAVN
jgi:GGDEF domain-containing protein